MEILKFGLNGCGPCVTVERFLKDEGVDFTSVNVEEEPEKQLNTTYRFCSSGNSKDGDKEIMRTTGYNSGQLGEIIDLYQGAQ